MVNRDVLVVGDVVCDEWRCVAHNSRNPENAGLVLLSQPDSEVILPGGAGLTALCLQQLGASVKLFSCVDTTHRGDLVMNTLVDAGVDGHNVVRAGAWHMPVKMRYLNDAHNIVVRHDIEGDATDYITPDAFNLSDFEAALRSAACVVVSDYDKGFLHTKRKRLIQLARKYDVPVFVDCKDKNINDYVGATVFKVNHKTAAAFANDASGREACGVLQSVTKAALVVVTRGDAGLVWQMPGRSPCSESYVLKHPAGNAVGAGDAFMAGLVMWFLMSNNLGRIDDVIVPDGLLVGHLVANRKITTIYPKLSPAQMLVDFCEYRFSEHAAAKIIDQNFFAAFARACAHVGKRVVFTNGCFDVLHAGHMHLLQESKLLGDVLIVALDADENVRRLKGPDRPVQDEQTRAQILAGLQTVDAVTVFTDNKTNDALRELITKCKPAVLVKGGDYLPEECVGWAEVTQRKDPGVVVCCALLPGFSTTKIINKVRGANV